MQLTLEEIQNLSPDESSLKAARGLVNPAKWPLLGKGELAIWGECQGSGAKPYQVQFDKAGLAFRCTCPSRKFPCKHGLALNLLALQHEGSFQTPAAPAWVSEWLETRQKKAEQAALKASTPQASPRTQGDQQAAAAKREAERSKRWAGGATELQQWLNDHIKQGVAALPSDITAWRQIAARMVDAQLPGLSNRLLAIGQLAGKHDDWRTVALGHMGELQLLLDGFSRIHELPQGVQADLLSALGETLTKEALLQTAPAIPDTWQVLGVQVTEEGKLWVRRAWLYGLNAKRQAMLLDFSHGQARFEPALATGQVMEANLHFYPGNAPLRAVFGTVPTPSPSGSRVPAVDNAESLFKMAQSLAANPWQWPQPLQLDGILYRQDSRWILRTGASEGFPLLLSDNDAWVLFALGGGEAMTWFGEWNGEAYRPLSVWEPELVWYKGQRTGGME